MQKKIIALAVAGLVSGGAFAQSNVTVYGIAGAYYMSAKVTDAAGVAVSTSNVVSGGESGSRLGFRGTEDLGGGLKANFVVETGVTLDAPAATSLGNRLATVGLSGDKWGSINLGHQYSPMHGHNASNDAGGYHDLGVVPRAQAFATRVSNSMLYSSPNMSGFQGQLMLGFGENGASCSPTAAASANCKGNDDGYGLRLAYANGPVAVSYAYHSTKVATTGSLGAAAVAAVPGNAGTAAIAASNGATGNNTAQAFGGSYDLGMAKLYANITRESTNASVKTKTWSLGAGIKAGANGTVVLSLANRNPDGANNDTKGWELSYSHALSKRTNLYAGYIQFNADGPANDQRTMAGIRHTF